MRTISLIAAISMLGACTRLGEPQQRETSTKLTNPLPCPSNGEVAVGCRPADESDHALVERWGVAPMYALGDANGNEEIDDGDYEIASSGNQGGGDGLCMRAADVDFDGAVGASDAEYIRIMRSTRELHLFNSAHLSCAAFSSIGSRLFALPGEEVPVIAFGNLRIDPAQGSSIRVDGPASLVAADDSTQHFIVNVDPTAQPGDTITVRVFAGVDAALWAQAPQDVHSGHVYVIQIGVLEVSE